MHTQERARLQAIMEAFSKAVHDLDNVAACDDLGANDEKLTASLRELGKRAGELATLPVTRKDATARDSWRHGARAVEEHARQLSELEGRARQENQALDVLRVRERLGRMRQSCLACHVRFVDAPTSPGKSGFPAVSNTLRGRVRVRKRDGAPRLDRRDVVVFLDAVPGAWRALATPQRITQKGRKFLPRVLPIVVGGRVDFPNEDVILHNVFSLSKTRPFDLGTYGSGKSRALRFPRTGLVRVYCNIHPEMNAHILVLGNPFFATTGPGGEWAITGVPDGRYELRVWSPGGGSTRKTVDLRDAALVDVDLEIRDSKTRVSHKNKFGRAYKGQYGRE